MMPAAIASRMSATWEKRRSLECGKSSGSCGNWNKMDGCRFCGVGLGGDYERSLKSVSIVLREKVTI